MEENTGNTALGNDTAEQADVAETRNAEGRTEQEQTDWEARFKGLQKSVQDRSLENKRLQAENEALAQQLNSITKPSIEIPEEIDELKYSDPDAWRSEINKLEQEAAQKVASERREILEQVKSEAAKSGELDRRKEVFAEFQASNPDLKIDDDVIANDVPPRISRKLENNEVTFEEYLEEVKNYLTAERIITKEPLVGDPSLGRVAGGSEPSLEAKISAASSSYANELY